MGKIERNAPCPCGSGKKYKKCCGKDNVVSMHQIIDQELFDMQLNIMLFAEDEFEEEIDDMVEGLLGEIEAPEEAEEVIAFHLTNWFIFSVPVYQGKTIIELYIERNLRMVKRPMLKRVLESWQDGGPRATRYLAMENDLLILEDIFTGNKLKVKLLDMDEDKPEEGELILGIILPMEEEFVFFTVFLNFPNDAEDDIIDLFEEDMHDDSAIFMMENYPAVLETTLFGGSGPITADSIEWDFPEHEIVAKAFEKAMDEGSEPEHLTSLGVVLWLKYCEFRCPIIKKPSMYVAALYYLIDDTFGLGVGITQKALAEKYGVSTTSISKYYREMFDVLEDDIDEMHSRLLEISSEAEEGWENDQQENLFAANRTTMERHLRGLEQELGGHEFENMEEFEQYMRNRGNDLAGPIGELSNKEKAQQLLFDAFDITDRKKRKQLVEKALKLDPNNPDAYNILTEDAKTLEDALKLSYQGMVRGEKDLGEAFFKENMGHFWMISSTRPYMRAKFNYAQLLHQNGNLEEAINQFNNLLELNEWDNQGVRYILLEAFIENGQVQEAKKLLNKYEEETANHLYNKLLIMLLDNGPDIGAKRILRAAKETNPFIPDYLVGKKKMPRVTPESYQLGAESEAIIYVSQYGHLWRGKKELLDWLKEN